MGKLNQTKDKKNYSIFGFYFRLAVHNMHYVSNVLGIRDPIHKQKIALKAMDVVLFGPPRGLFIQKCENHLIVLEMLVI